MSEANVENSQWVTISVPDGSTMKAYVTRPVVRVKVPAVIVTQEIFGVNAHIKDIADRLAGEGYLAIAPELFHRTAPVGWEGSYDDFAASMPHKQAMTASTLEADIKATYEHLKKEPACDVLRVGILGMCMGGRAAFFGNAILPFQAAVSFYGGGIAQDLLPMATEQRGPILLIWGGKDKHILSEHRRAVSDALQKADKPYVEIDFSYADHGFLCNHRKSYHPAAAKEAWALTKAFLETNLKSP